MDELIKNIIFDDTNEFNKYIKEELLFFIKSISIEGNEDHKMIKDDLIKVNNQNQYIKFKIKWNEQLRRLIIIQKWNLLSLIFIDDKIK